MTPTLSRAMAPLDVAMRLLYFTLAPAMLVAIGTKFPILGIVINLALAVVVFTFAATFRGWVGRFPLLGRVLGEQLKFEQFYHEHPPRPFLFYVAYPLLLPYVLYNKTTRRELGLYKGPTVVGAILLLVSAVVDYQRNWAPEIKFGTFFGSWIALLILQAIVCVVFVMPLATTLVALELGGRRRVLSLLLVAATLSSALSVRQVMRKRHEVELVPTKNRMYARTIALPKRSEEVRTAALRRAFDSHRAGDGETWNGKRATEIYGKPIEDARAVLSALYREDETRCFHLAELDGKDGAILVLFAIPGSSSKPVVWAAMDEDRKVVRDGLPDGAFATLRRIAQH